MQARPGVEALVEEAARLAGSGGLLFFEAPPGYGKTSATPLVYRRGRREAGLPRVVHALPLRAVVEQAYRRFAGALSGEAVVGYQAHGLGLEGKSPFMASHVVVSTLQSLALNLFRWNVAEAGLGHYEVPRAHIASSLVVLDEAHMPLGAGADTATALAAVVRALASMGVPVVVETATMPPRMLESLLGYLPPGAAGGASRLAVTPPGSCRGRGCVEDPGFYDAVAATEWLYHALPAGGAAGAARLAAELAGLGLRVFLASSRVSDAVEAFRLLREAGVDAVLVHGRLTAADRSRAVERVGDAAVVVGTSAVEAGVDFDSDVLITDLPVRGGGPDWMGVVQRLGRVCRRPGRCSGARVYIYGPGAGEAARRLEGVNPRLPVGEWRGQRGYARLLGEAGAVAFNAQRLAGLEKLALSVTPSAEQIRAAHRLLCDPLRGDLLVPAVVPPGEAGGGGLRAGELAAALEEGRYVLLDAWTARRRARDWLLLESGRFAALHARYRASRGHPGDAEYAIEAHGLRELDCRGLARLYSEKGLVALVLRPGAYVEGVGLA